MGRSQVMETVGKEFVQDSIIRRQQNLGLKESMTL